MIDTGEIEVGQYDVWGRYAGEIERGFRRRWAEREAFWRALYRNVAKAEVRKGTRTHKGLIFFKIGAMGLFCGRTFPSVLRWFGRAYEEDKRLSRFPKQESAYRMLTIVGAFERFCRGIRNQNARRVVGGVVARHRARISRLIGAVYDRTLMDPPLLRGLGWAAFDKLLGRNPYRALVEQNYRGAEWLCSQKKQIERTNLEKYGLAQAVIVLSGTTIEGILLAKPAIRRRVRAMRDRGARYTLDSLTVAYLAGLRGAAELTAGLVFVWFARNLIHPEVGKKAKDFLIDMNFADFTWTLTSEIIARMARRARPRQLP